VRQYVKTERGWCERMVTALDGALQFALAPVPVPKASVPAGREAAPDGGVFETSPASTALAEEIRGGMQIHAAAGGNVKTLQQPTKIAEWRPRSDAPPL